MTETTKTYTWRGRTLTAEELGRAAAEERAKLANPVDRIALDNEWVGGMPLGLFRMAVSK